MNKKQMLCAGLSLGTGLMYFFDPNRGRRRRASVRDTVTHMAKVTDNAIGKASRDFSNRVDGLVAEVTSLFKYKEIKDEVLVEQVRSKLGRVVSHPHAIEVAVEQGVVTLSGQILTSEVDPLLKCVYNMCGVTSVENKLEPHEQSNGISSLQGGKSQQSSPLQTNWSPTTRLLAGAAGSALAIYGMRHRGLTGSALKMLGIGLVARGATNLELSDLIGLRDGHGIRVQKTIHIDAPVEQVYEIWSHLKDFPHFMSRVREVKDLGNGRYHWTVTGPAGIPCSWEGRITKQVPNKVLEFESMPGALIPQQGIVRFEPTEQGGTSVDIKMAYHPPAGAVGHMVAKLFGADPRSEMIADLMRMKSFIETGHQPHDAAERRAASRQITLDETQPLTESASSTKSA